MDPSVAYFGLRTNAHQLVSGAGVAAVKRRIKLASLLHDQVMLELGIYELQAGPSGSLPIYYSGPAEGEVVRWQTPRERHPHGGFHWGLRRSDAPEGTLFRPMLSSETRLRWRASFLPLVHEVGGLEAFPWLRGAWIEDAPRTSTVVNQMARRDQDDPILRRTWPDQFVRSAVARGAATDFKRVSETGTTLYADPFHARLLAARVARGDAVTVLGQEALRVIEPRELSWQEVADLRAVPGLVEYRAVLRDIEGAAREQSTSRQDLHERILRGYSEALARASTRMPSWRTRLTLVAFGIVVGKAVTLAANGLPFVGSVAGGVFGDRASQVAGEMARPRWLAADARLHRRT